jgi:hypothetical protein
VETQVELGRKREDKNELSGSKNENRTQAPERK